MTSIYTEIKMIWSKITSFRSRIITRIFSAEFALIKQDSRLVQTVNKQKRARFNLEESPTAQNTPKKQEAFLWELKEELTQRHHSLNK